MIGSFRIIPRRYSFETLELPEIPEDLSALSAEALTELESRCTAYFTENREAARTDRAVFTNVAAAGAAIKDVRARLAAIAAEPPAAPTADELAALDAEFAQSDPPVDPPVDPPADPTATLQVAEALNVAELATAVATSTAEAVTAALAASGEVHRGEVVDFPRITRFRSRDAIVASSGDGRRSVITASADIPGVNMGSEILDFAGLAHAFEARSRGLGNSNVVYGEKVGVASIRAMYPDEQRLIPGKDLIKQTEHICSPDAVMASGGLCAPVAPYYGQMVLASDMRPVAAAVPTWGADRGGMRYVPPPVLTSLQASSPDPNPYFLGNAIGVETVAEDAAGAAKLCLDVPCNNIMEVDINIIYRCLQFANVTSRTFPEQVEAFIRLAAAGWAQAAEGVLLDGIMDASTPVTVAKAFGTFRDLVASLGNAAAYLRNHNRTDPKLTIRVLLPAWVRDACRADLTRTFAGSMEFFAVADAVIDNALAEYGIVASWYIDEATGTDQLFAVANPDGGVLPTWPTTVACAMFFEGSFLHLDAGILDLGIIRDSTLTALNKFRNFAESFENIVFIGPEALWLTLTTCPDGGLAAAYTIASQDCSYTNA